MPIENIPEIYLIKKDIKPDLYVYAFTTSAHVLKNKVHLSMHMFSFLKFGKKQVHFSDNSVEICKDQSILLKKGNWLWTEILDVEEDYYCKLLFFSDKKLKEFLAKHLPANESVTEEIPYFVISNDAYIKSYLDSLTTIRNASPLFTENLLAVKFEELMLYLLQKYGKKFENYLKSLVNIEPTPFKEMVESKIQSNLKLEEIAFLNNMSLSTFKRHFIREFKVSPGKWFQNKRLQLAKKILEEEVSTPSELFYKLGYNNLSNFSTAFKNKFGVSPSQVQ